ncbi:hypothetical protein B7463_g82, partial [Scytalidium lignicola]
MAGSPCIDDKELSKEYLQRASRTIEGIDSNMFSSDNGHYLTSDSIPTGMAKELHRWLIYQNISPKHLHTQLLSKLSTALFGTTHNGYPLSFSPKTPKVPPVISPIMPAFHILAAISADDHQTAEHVLRTVFAPMYNKASPHFTGTCWEFLNADGTPFKDQFCSYAQLFSVSPIFILSRYVLRVEPVEAGFKQLRIAPRFKVSGVTWAQGRVPTPVGELLEMNVGGCAQTSIHVTTNMIEVLRTKSLEVSRIPFCL